jgi:hypothetical protein
MAVAIHVSESERIRAFADPERRARSTNKAAVPVAERNTYIVILNFIFKTFFFIRLYPK